MYNTPTKQTELFLGKYQNLDESVISDIDSSILIDSNMTDTQKTRYKEVLKRQYKDLTYMIKDETIDGDSAKVTVEIEVYDFYKELNKAKDNKNENNKDILDDNGKIDESLYINYQLNKLSEAKERVKYTLELSLTKVEDDWKVNDLSNDELEKISGVYAY